MSVQVQIDYEQIAVRCESVCEAAEAAAAELDGLLEKISANASALQNGESEALEKSIRAEKEAILKRVRAVRAKAEEAAKQGTVHTNNHDARYAKRDEAIEEAERLQGEITALAGERVTEYESLLTALLGERLQDDRRKARERRSGAVTVDAPTQAVLDSVGDEVLRQFTLLAYLGDNTLTGDSLRRAGEELMEKTVNQTCEARYEEEAERIRRRIAAARADGKNAEKALRAEGKTAKERIIAAQEAATGDIVDEKVRQKSLRIIMKAVQARGFIVDRKNIKINREKNEVTLVALKASGEKAEFRVFLDGKFIYEFRDGYKGQACQKDAGPFLKDLEEVYGVHIKKQTEIWSNPDKISSMKYQTYRTDRNGK